MFENHFKNLLLQKLIWNCKLYFLTVSKNSRKFKEKFENNSKYRIQHFEQSELRLHLE